MKHLLRISAAIIGIYLAYIIGYFMGIEPRLFVFSLIPVYSGGVYVYAKNKYIPGEMTDEEAQLIKTSFLSFVLMGSIVVIMWAYLIVTDKAFNW